MGTPTGEPSSVLFFNLDGRTAILATNSGSAMYSTEDDEAPPVVLQNMN